MPLNITAGVEISLLWRQKWITGEVLAILDASRMNKVRNSRLKTAYFGAETKKCHHFLAENLSVPLNINAGVGISLLWRQKWITGEVLAILDTSRMDKVRELRLKTTYFGAEAQKCHHFLNENLSVPLNINAGVEISLLWRQKWITGEVLAILDASRMDKVRNLRLKTAYFGAEAQKFHIFSAKTCLYPKYQRCCRDKFVLAPISK